MHNHLEVRKIFESIESATRNYFVAANYDSTAVTPWVLGLLGKDGWLHVPQTFR